MEGLAVAVSLRLPCVLQDWSHPRVVLGGDIPPGRRWEVRSPQSGAGRWDLSRAALEDGISLG